MSDQRSSSDTELPIALWTEWARRDDWHQRFVGSDIRQMLGEIERLRTALREIARHDGDIFGDIARKALAVSSTDRKYDPNVAPCDDAEFGMKP